MNMNIYLKYIKVQSIRKTETQNRSCVNHCSTYQYLGSTLRT
jgi:hypothetical protein